MQPKFGKPTFAVQSTGDSKPPTGDSIHLKGYQEIYEPRKKGPLLLSIESWLVDRDPYNGLLKSLYNWVV